MKQNIFIFTDAYISGYRAMLAQGENMETAKFVVIASNCNIKTLTSALFQKDKANQSNFISGHWSPQSTLTVIKEQRISLVCILHITSITGNISIS